MVALYLRDLRDLEGTVVRLMWSKRLKQQMLNVFSGWLVLE